MTQRGSSHNFMFKYAPLRLRGVNQPTSSSRGNMSASPLLFSPRVPLSSVNPGPRMLGPLTNSTAEFEATSSVDILNSSLDNITNWCQQKERRNGEIQALLEASETEKERLQVQLDNLSIEKEQLLYINKKFQESQRDIETELQDVHQLYTEVKTTLEATAATLEDLREDRKCWLSKFEEIQKKVFDGKIKQMQIDLNRMTEEKQTRIDSMRRDADQILTELRDAVVERDCLKGQLTEVQSELNCIIDDNRKIEQERNKFEKEWIQLKNTFDLSLSEKTSQIIEESIQVKARNLANVQELNELREKLAIIQTEFQTTTSQLQLMKQLDREEPRDLLKTEIASSRNQIKQLNAANDAKDTELNALKIKLTSNQEALATYEDVKHSLNILSKEMEALQERYKCLEKQFDLTNEQFLKCTSQRDQLETNLTETKKLFDEECQKNQKLETKTQELVQELASYQQIIEENKSKLDDLVIQLGISKRNNQQLQETLNDTNRKLEEKVSLEENSQKVIAELKCQLTTKAIELQYKEKRMEETEKVLNEMMHQSENPGQAESIRSEADPPKPKGKTEIEKLKTTLNLKNLELESVNEQLNDAQQMVCSAERKITDLELTVSMLEHKLELERKQACVSFEANREPSRQEVVSVQPGKELDFITEKNQSKSISSSKAALTAPPNDKLTTENLVEDNLETLNLLQKANAIAKAEELKRQYSENSLTLMKKPLSPPTLLPKPQGKKRRLDRDHSSRDLSIKMDSRDSVPESPVIRNKSGVLTSRFIDRTRSTMESTDGE